MGVYIKGMEMPKKQIFVILNPNGLVEVLDANNVLLEEYQAVFVPPHGRMIDADALRCLYDPHDYGLDGEQADEYDRYHVSLPVIRQNIDDMPTIIEAEEGE